MRANLLTVKSPSAGGGALLAAKSALTLPRALCLTFGLCFWAHPLKAQTDFTWDNASSDNVVTGGTGDWDVTNTNWTTNGGATNVSWGNVDPPNNAIFGGASGTVTVTAPITLGNLTFNSGYTISGGTLTFGSATPTITANNVLGIISSVVSGSSGLTFAATGAIAGTYLDGNNTYTGVTTVNSGFLIARNAGSLGGSADGTVVASGATLQLESGGGVSIADEAVTISGTGVGGTRGALASWSGNNVWGGSVTMAANSTVLVNSGNLSVNGVISGTGFNLTKSGGGQLTLGGSASNTYTGTTIVDVGTLVLSKTGGASAIIGTMQLGGGTANQPYLRMGGSNQFGPGVVVNFPNASGNWGRFELLDTNQTLAGLNAGTTTVQGGAVTQNGGFNLNGTSGTSVITLNGSGDYVYHGYLRNVDTGGTGKLGITMNGTGSQVLAGGNVVYTGPTVVNAGRLELFNTAGYNSATTINTGTTLRWNGNTNIQNNNAGATIALNDGGTLENFNPINWTVINGAVTNSGTTTINHSVTAATAGDRGFFLDGGLKGTGTVTINATTAGSGVNLRNNNSTFAGTLIVNGIPNATPFLGSGISVGGNTTGLANADITLNGTMELLNKGIGWANVASGAFSMGALNGTGVMVGNFTSGGVTTVTMGNTNNTGNFTGTITNGVGNIIVIVKNGSGTQTLGSANVAGSGITYTGGTTVNAGQLTLVDARLSVAAKTVASGATLEINSSIPFTTRWNNSGTIAGAGTLLKTGSGVFGITGLMNFTGLLNIQGGRVHNDNTTANWNASTADVLIGSAGILDLRANGITIDELNGTGEVWSSHSANGNIQNLTVGIANGSSTFGGIIRGNDTTADELQDAAFTRLIKQGTGEFTLSGVNTFTGGATVNNGVLRISGGNDRIFPTNVLTVNGGDPAGGIFDLNALNQTVSGLAGGSGVVPGVVTNTTTGTGTLTVSGTSTFDGNIQDGGAGKVVALTKSNNGTLALTGVNTQTGPTLITGGALRQSSATALSPNSNIQLNGGIVELGMTDFGDVLGTGGGQIQFLGSGGFGAFGAPRNLNIGGMLDDLVWGTGNFVPNGSSLILSGPNSNDTVRLQNGLDLNGGAGRITSLGGTAAIDAELLGDIYNGTLTLAPVNSTFLISGLVNAATVVENGVGATNNIQVVLNRPGGNAINGALQIGLASATNFATVRLGADQQIADSTVVTFGAPSGKWSYLNLNGFNETIGGLSNLTGMDGGVVQLVELDASPAVDSTLTLNVTSGTQSYLGHIRDRSSGWSNHATAGKLHFIKTGNGTQELATWNSQTWSGTTTVQAGTLRLILNNGAVLPGAITVDSTATLDLAPAGTNNYQLRGAVSGDGTVVKSGPGTATFYNSAVSLTGNIQVQAGTLRNDGNTSDWSASSANLDVSSGAIFDLRADSVRVNALTGAGVVTNSFGNGLGVFDTLTVGVNGASSHFSGNITDGGTGSGEGKGGLSLTKEGAGTQILSGNNTYSGTTTVAAGTLQIGNGGTSGSLGTGPVVNDASLVFNRSDDSVATGPISGTGNLTKQGDGVLTLNSSSTYLGSTTIAAGTVRLGASQTMNVTSDIWLDAADGSRVNTGGGVLTSWTNKGSLGSAADAVPLAGQEPAFVSSVAALNNNPAIRFDADATGGAPFDRIVLPQNYTTGNVTIIYAGRLTGGANQRLVAGANNNWLLGTWNNNSESAFFNNGFLANSVAPDTVARIYTGTIATGGAAEFYVNGVLKGTGAGAQGPNGISLGGGFSGNPVTEYADGDIGEFLVFTSVLTPMERQQVQDYLARKWQGAGTLNVLPTTTKVTLTNSGAKLDINGVIQSVAGLSGVSGTQVLLGGGSLTTGLDNADATFSGDLSGTGNFTKTGSGVQTMGGTNTAAGITNLTGGTLMLASNTALSPSSELTLSTGTTLKTNGFSADTGAITLNAGTAVIDMSGGNSTLTFADINNWSGVLQVWNYDGGIWQNTSNDKLVFTANNSLAVLDTVEFYSGPGTGLIGTGAGFYSGSEGQLVPVPEPTALAGLLALVGFAWRREMRRRC